MEILSVTLKNFKSHRDRHFTFQPGTNAICGENGAGKTSILEAIAWVLFNHRGAYKNEDLIHNGSGSAQVTVALVSQRDGRTYEVQRCTSRGYTIFDPQLGVRLDYRHIEDEIMPWLRQQLGVAPGTDLARLFANTVGVPQGTFTLDFLQAPDKRKQIFDAILKVEEYRQANQQLLSLEKYGKAETEALERSIAQYEESLSDWDRLKEQQQTLKQEIAEQEATLEQLQTRLAVLQTEKDMLAAQAEKNQQFQVRLQQLAAQMEGNQQAVGLLQQQVAHAQQAVEFCTAHRTEYQGYLQVETVLQELNQKLSSRQTIWQQRESQHRRLSQSQTQLTRLSLRLEALTEAAATLEQLQPHLTQQTALEQQQSAVVEQLNQLQALKAEQQTLRRQLQTLRAEQAKLVEEIAQIQTRQTEVNQIPALEQKRERLQEQLSRIEAAKQFEAELRQLVTAGESRRDHHQQQAEQALAILTQVQQSVPLLTVAPVETVIASLRAGVSLNTELLNALWRILADLSEQISVPRLQQQLWQTKTQLEAAYQSQVALANLTVKQSQVQQNQGQQQPLNQRLEQLQAALATESHWQQQRSDLIAALNQLGNPRGQVQLLERDLQQQPALQTQYSQLGAQHQVLQQQLAELEAQLAAFAEVEAEIEQQQQQRQTYQQGYQIYLKYQQTANQFAPLSADLQTAQTQLNRLQTEQAAVQAEATQQLQHYDPLHYQTIETSYSQTRSQVDQILGSLPQQHQRLLEAEHQLNQKQILAQKRDRTQLELKQTEKVRKFITFARKVYKEAGPRITERYVQTVSREADRLFRELLNRPNVALEWTREYEILVQEGAHSRRLINLSGGEQMCAALAVRLALLRVLADIDIAFFDEPTTNMDRPRRQSLAEAIANIKTFRQLFVISHDDTFEQVTENVILVEREI